MTAGFISYMQLLILQPSASTDVHVERISTVIKVQCGVKFPVSCQVLFLMGRRRLDMLFKFNI